MKSLTKGLIKKYLERLGLELDKRGCQGEILLAGGVSMCLVPEAQDSYKDIDDLYKPKTIVNQFASTIAKEEGLPTNWLNDSFKEFIGPNGALDDVLIFKGLRIQTVAIEYLLAMKLLAASSGSDDFNDIVFLMKKIGITTIKEADNLSLSYYPVDQVMPKTQFIIEEALKIINKTNSKIE
ncbi:MAG: hypothetical protein LBS60_09705 [Deltaproteobacteria bacterium]|jgi:hypothetical protein|nr:hypothetical protein [Deltaproteobacteria bacterium]